MTRSQAMITLGVMLSLFMASMEATVVATAMPTIISHLGGLAAYSWVFSAYLLASTTTIPIYGKLSDVYGRRPVFAVAMGLFLLGSVLSGQAGSMSQLIAFRALQGLGAGGILPLVFTIVGAIFTLEQRARMQGLFSGMWGLSSIIGPLLGGFLVDHVSWRWVFYINVPLGIPAVVVMYLFWVEDVRHERRLPVDYPGAVVLSLSVLTLLLGLFRSGTPTGPWLLALAVVLFALLAWIERRAADPVLPLGLFRERLFAVACAHGALSGWAMFGSLAFVPLFVQAVLSTTATRAGATLTPLLLAWMAASTVGSRLLLRVGYRALALTGMALLTVGTFFLSRIGTGSGQAVLMVDLALMGIGMGMSVPAFLIAVQTGVERRALGIATSTLQFTRSMGGVLGLSVMGAVLSGRLAVNLQAVGGRLDQATLSRLLDPVARLAGGTALGEALRSALAGAIQGVFVIALVAAAVGFAVTSLAPGGRIAQLVHGREERSLEPPSRVLDETVAAR